MFKVCYFYIITLIVKEATCFKKENILSCEETTSQLISLFNVMCENIADIEDLGLRDACVGCFTRASRSNNNQPSIGSLAECANIYLLDTRYNDCVDIITVAQTSSTGGCVSGYCDFVRCIRRVNSDLLIARCFSEASADNPAELEAEQIILYKNITSCILAVSRCSLQNPITGQSQTNTITSTTYGKLGIPKSTTVPLYNTLQINQAGDIRIVTFPGTTTIQKYLCPFAFNLKETSWLNYSC